MLDHPVRREGRIPMVRLEGEAEPVPLKSLGDGMLRMFQIALAMEGAAGDPRVARQQPLFPESEASARLPLLIDEIENGIHYTALPALWMFLFEAATRHDVQVFATSHSWDSVEAFQFAAAKAKHMSAKLVRLERTDKGHRAVSFSGEELATLARQRVEVR